MRNLISLLFVGGLVFLLLVLTLQAPFAEGPMLVGKGILQQGTEETGTANLVTSVVLGYRGYDTLGELSILFTAALALGVVLGRRRPEAPRDPEAGLVLRASSDLLFPLLLVVGLYIILHGHLTPGGGFQGGVILAAAFFLPVLARPSQRISHAGLMALEALAGAAFIIIGLLAMRHGGQFLQPLLDKGQLGSLLSGGTLPLLYIAVGVKVGAELAGLLVRLGDAEADS